MLAGTGLVEVVLPALINIGRGLPNAKNWAVSALIAYLFLYSLISSYIVSFQLTNTAMLMTEAQKAFNWIKQYTPPASRFIILSKGGSLSDPLSEWFPAMSNRTSLTTIFGTEWLKDESLRLNTSRYNDLQTCLSSDANCIQTWAKKYDIGYTHILFRKQPTPTLLLVTLQTSNDYQQIYDNQGFIIFEKIH
jgi:hypothetical protein